MDQQQFKRAAMSDSEDTTLIDDRERFILLSTQITDLAGSVGIKIKPFHRKSLPHFSRLDASSRTQTLQSLSDYCEVYLATRNQGFSLLDSGRVIWNFLRRIGCRPTSDLFNYFQFGNVVEIHDIHLVQIFRNFNFFQFCTYTLEELYCYPFTQLYRRENDVETGIIDAFTRIHQGDVTHVIPVNVAPHVISENLSEGRLQISAEVKFVAPLFLEKTNAVAGTIVIEEGKICRRATLPSSEDAGTAQFAQGLCLV